MYFYKQEYITKRETANFLAHKLGLNFNVNDEEDLNTVIENQF
jgi:hypothetical protein